MSSSQTQAWSVDELDAAVIAYLAMLKMELQREPYNKAATNQALRNGPLANRNRGSIEQRMHNISAVMSELRLPTIKGYVPKGNVGSNVKQVIINAINTHSGDMPFAPTSDAHTYEERAQLLCAQPMLDEPLGILSPKKSTSTITTFERDPTVKAWVLQNSGMHCEGCGNLAPFEKAPGVGYLEVHHVIPLAEDGADTTTNTVALCPNCHRKCHHSHTRADFIRELYEKVTRLVPRPDEPDQPEQIFI